MARRTTIILARLAAPIAVTALLAGCAEVHHGAEAVGRFGGPPAPVAGPAEDDAALAPPPVKTVRPPGAPRTAADAAPREPAPAPVVVATAVPSPRQIFDFHPPGSRADSWRQPFVIDTNDGPLAADVHRSAAELKAFMADHKGGEARPATAEAGRIDAAATGTTRKRCSEADVAAAKPGCGVPPAAGAPPARPATP